MRRRHLLPTATLVVALVTAALVAFAPLSRSTSCWTDGLTEFCSSSSPSLVETEGASVLGVLLVPAVLALIGAVRPTQRVLGIVAGLLVVGCVLAVMSVGVFYLPTVLVAAVAAARA